MAEPTHYAEDEKLQFPHCTVEVNVTELALNRGRPQPLQVLQRVKLSFSRFLATKKKHVMCR
jgi:hypothetical protein